MTVLRDIPLYKVVPYINWTYFFKAWKVPIRYRNISILCDSPSCKRAWLSQFSESAQEKAEEALQLYCDAQTTLRQMEFTNTLSIQAVYRFVLAHSVPGGIVLYDNDKEVLLPTLRQQVPQADGFCRSLCDFVSPQSDEIGLFAIAVADQLQEENCYLNLLRQSLCDRLVEATSEYLHQYLLKGKGIRPAIGYPSLPDQSLVFVLDRLLDMEQIGIVITENGAMNPHSSVCGVYIKHPKSRYFMVGKISEEQLNQYAAARGQTPEQMKKWLAKNC